MAKGVAYDEDVIMRCMQAIDEGVPLATVSRVEGVGLATLYNWRARRSEDIDLRTDPKSENERLRAENARLRLVVSRMNALMDDLFVLRKRVEGVD